MIIRIFPNTRKEFDAEEKLRDWLNDELRLRGGEYHLRTTNGVGSIPAGSIVLFRFEKNIVGHAVVKKDVVSFNKKIDGIKYEGMIQFKPSSIKVYKKALPIEFLEKITGRNFSFGRAYFRIETSDLFHKILAEIKK